MQLTFYIPFHGTQSCSNQEAINIISQTPTMKNIDVGEKLLGREIFARRVSFRCEQST